MQPEGGPHGPKIPQCPVSWKPPHDGHKDFQASIPSVLASSTTTPFTQVRPPLLAPCYQPTMSAGLLGLGFQILPSPHLAAPRLLSAWLLHLPSTCSQGGLSLHCLLLGPIPASHNLKPWSTALEIALLLFILQWAATEPEAQSPSLSCCTRLGHTAPALRLAGVSLP